MKKAQISMEYLMTYGWVILAIFAGFAALAYFGIFTPQDLLTGHTIFQGPIENLDDANFILSTNNIEIVFQNNKGLPIIIPRTGTFISSQCASGNISSVRETITGSDINDSRKIGDGERFLIRWTCTPTPGTKKGDRIKADITFDYKNVQTGQIIAQRGTLEGKWN